MNRTSKVVLGKKEIIQKVVETMNPNIKKQEINNVVDVFLDVILESLSKGQQIKINGYLSLWVVINPKRTVRNPKKDELITVGERPAIKFRAGSKLKKAGIKFFNNNKKS